VSPVAPHIGNDVSYVTVVGEVGGLTLPAPRIGNDVPHVTRITDDIHFGWRAQYLVKLEGDSCCSAHFK